MITFVPADIYCMDGGFLVKRDKRRLTASDVAVKILTYKNMLRFLRLVFLVILASDA